MEHIKKFALILVTLILVGCCWQSASAEDTLLYTVTWGDTLSGIAADHGTTVARLLALNQIANPDYIEVGQVLRVPISGGSGNGVLPQGGPYTVVRGDTLGKIAQRYNTTVAELASLNGIDNPNFIRTGQTLLIQPGTGGGGYVTGDHYVVARGDTLNRIARLFHTTAEDLCGLNGIADPDFIVAGQVLRVR